MVPRSRKVFAIIAAPALLTAWVIVCGARTGDKTMDADMNRPPLGGDAHQGRSGSKTNRLIHEKSPYLLQHAHNPVDWYPWGEEAFEQARTRDKPIFLSIGYSTCHWCHVMERESFEDEETAAIMNDTFVSIKVDREERPDIDHLYMTVCQMMTGSGGWPLNVVLTPDKRPFFAGTYFPRETRYGRIGVQDFSKRIKHLWDNERNVVLESAGKVTNALRQLPDDLPGDPLGSDVLDASYEQLAQRFDKEHGGFSEAPKFPTPHNMLFLLRYWKRTGNAQALDMVTKTLDAMRLGGIYDHVGFGFHRYSTDAHWLVPHFEKMLYDQALISFAYVEAYQATGKPEYAQTAKEIFAYVLRDMTSSEGGFYSAEDADSEGEEGRFFVWTLAEIRHIVPPEDLDLTAEVFQVEAAGNFAEESTGLFKGNNILHLSRSLADLAAAKEIPLPELEARVKTIREKLYAYREQRVHPHKDDKILTDWNGLMISSLARGAQVFGNSEYLAAARKAADFILGTLREPSGRLLHRYRQGEAGLPAHVDDYAFFVSGLIDLYEACFESRYLEAAIELNRDFVERFRDGESGGFYFTARDGEALLLRKKEIYDGATPSGNSVAALNLVRLGRITGDVELDAKAERLFKAFSGTVRQFPSAYTQLLSAVAFALGPSFEVTIAGFPESDETAVLLAALRRPFVPNKVVLFRTEAEEAPAITKIAPYTAVQRASGGKSTAYVCRNYQCELPTADPKSMLRMLGVGE